MSAHARTPAGPSLLKDQTLPWRDQVHLERLRLSECTWRDFNSSRVGGTAPSPPPPPRPSTGEWLPPPAFLPLGLAAPVLLSWSHWDLARGLPHRPRDDVSRVAVAGAWDAQAALGR